MPNEQDKKPSPNTPNEQDKKPSPNMTNEQEKKPSPNMTNEQEKKPSPNMTNEQEKKPSPNMTNEQEKKEPIPIRYTYVGDKVAYMKELLDSIPDQFKPTPKTVYFLIIIMTVIIGIGILDAMAPIRDIGNFDVKSEKQVELNIDVGFPLKFFYSSDEGRDINMDWFNLFIDILIITIISYLLDVAINFLLTLKLTETEEEKKRHPKIFQFKKAPASQQVAEKMTGKENPIPNTENSDKEQNTENKKTKTPQQDAKEKKPENNKQKQNTEKTDSTTPGKKQPKN